MQPVALELAEPESVFGGKSFQLGACLRNGLPVPPGWALSVALVDAIVQADADALTALRLLLQDQFEPLAVRSSAVGEDALIASFAGQHFTELNRTGFEQVRQAVQMVWHSGHSDGAKAYREKLGVTVRPCMAIALQKMVFPDIAGVMFTRHPVTGADEIVIEATWGLGEAIVEGLVIPDRFRLAKDGSLKESSVGIKDLRVVSVPGGGIAEQAIDDAQKISDYCLNESQIAALVGLGLRCEAYFGPGRDIEWGIANNVLYLLQCRSITTRFSS